MLFFVKNFENFVSNILLRLNEPWADFHGLWNLLGKIIINYYSYADDGRAPADCGRIYGSITLQWNSPLRARWLLLYPYIICKSECPWVSPTQYYSYAPNFDCRATCPPGFYAFNGNLSCVAACPTSPNMTYYDDVNRKCVTVCPANYFAATNRSCLQCTSPSRQPVRPQRGETQSLGLA